MRQSTNGTARSKRAHHPKPRHVAARAPPSRPVAPIGSFADAASGAASAPATPASAPRRVKPAGGCSSAAKAVVNERASISIPMPIRSIGLKSVIRLIRCAVPWSGLAPMSSSMRSVWRFFFTAVRGASFGYATATDQARTSSFSFYSRHPASCERRPPVKYITGRSISDCLICLLDGVAATHRW